MKATVNPLFPGSRLDADHPENGVLIPCRSTNSVLAVQPYVGKKPIAKSVQGIVLRFFVLPVPTAAQN